MKKKQSRKQKAEKPYQTSKIDKYVGYIYLTGWNFTWRMKSSNIATNIVDDEPNIETSIGPLTLIQYTWRSGAKLEYNMP